MNLLIQNIWEFDMKLRKLYIKMIYDINLFLKNIPYVIIFINKLKINKLYIYLTL